MNKSTIHTCFKYCLALFTLISSFPCYAALGPVPYSSDWKFDIAPYLWAINMNGHVQAGPISTHLDQNFGDLLDHLNIGGMLWLDAYNGPFGLFANALYASSSVNGDEDAIDSHASNHFGIFSLGASYEIYQSGMFGIEPYIGVRYTINNTHVKASYLSLSASASDNQHWADPIIGANLLLNFSPNWSGMLSGDIGGINGSTHYSYNVAALLGYTPVAAHTTFYLGYRLLDQHYQTGNGDEYFDWNMKLFGPMLGIDFSFA